MSLEYSLDDQQCQFLLTDKKQRELTQLDAISAVLLELCKQEILKVFVEGVIKMDVLEEPEQEDIALLAIRLVNQTPEHLQDELVLAIKDCLLDWVISLASRHCLDFDHSRLALESGLVDTLYRASRRIDLIVSVLEDILIELPHFKCFPYLILEDFKFDSEPRRKIAS